MIPETPASIDDNDTNFVKYKTIKKNPNTVKNKNGAYQSSTPAEVATAFPPLNFAKSG